MSSSLHASSFHVAPHLVEKGMEAVDLSRMTVCTTARGEAMTAMDRHDPTRPTIAVCPCSFGNKQYVSTHLITTITLVSGGTLDLYWIIHDPTRKAAAMATAMIAAPCRYMPVL